MPQPNLQLATPPELPLGVTLTLAEWQMVVNQLGTGPYNQMAQLIDKMSRHLTQRIEEFHAQNKESA